MEKYLYQCYRYSLIVCRNKQGKYLVVQENRALKKDHGWWIPGGKVEVNETFLKAAERECLEESGVGINIKGIIRVDYGMYFVRKCLRVVYYAEPKDEGQGPKDFKDQHSLRAMFKTLDEIEQIRWRSPEIFDFPFYVETGGKIHPLSIFEENFNC